VSRGRYVGLAVIACLIPVAIFVWQNAPKDEAARASVDEALGRFRKRDEGSGGARFGVYRYWTRGSESADTGFLSATHDYDGISTIILARAPCGVLERWQVLAGRWTEEEFCMPPDGSGLRAISEFHEFFGTQREDTYHCRGGAPSRRLLRQLGTRFSSSCVSDSSRADSVSQVVGGEKVRVAGEAIDAIHTISSVVLDGNISGATTRDDWRRRSDGLLLQRAVGTQAKMSGTVDADYSERYTIKLLSVRPRR
jgi:hypothetical protein